MSLPRSLLSATLLTLLSATPAIAGPVWLSVELPANPNWDLTRGAFLMVRTYHHREPTSFPLSGSAEGLVNGERRSVPLTLTATNVPGLYVLRYTPATEGAWLLRISIGGGQEAASALVSLDKNGQVSSVRVPAKDIEGGRWKVPQPVSPAEIDAMLRAQVALNGGGGNTALPAVLVGLALLPAGLVLRRR